ncbi:helix-turn-helix domain-containing protein [Priestia sp. OVL9]|nr:helix-turn-helix domain-containing protein [Priestia sp. OVL9]
MELTNEKVRKRFIKMLEVSGVSMKFICKKIGFNYTTVSKWKNGKTKYSPANLLQIERIVDEYMKGK